MSTKMALALLAIALLAIFLAALSWLYRNQDVWRFGDSSQETQPGNLVPDSVYYQEQRLWAEVEMLPTPVPTEQRRPSSQLSPAARSALQAYRMAEIDGAIPIEVDGRRYEARGELWDVFFLAPSMARPWTSDLRLIGLEITVEEIFDPYVDRPLSSAGLVDGQGRGYVPVAAYHVEPRPTDLLAVGLIFEVPHDAASLELVVQKPNVHPPATPVGEERGEIELLIERHLEGDLDGEPAETP